MRAKLLHRFGALALPIMERLSGATWNGLPRPGNTHVVARGAGHDPDRVLLTGGSSAVGWGVADHDLSLAGHLARSTAAITERGIDVDVNADARMSAPMVQRALTSATISRYDA